MEPITALIAFALITMSAIMVEILYTYATQGIGFGFSSNRPIVEKTALGLRIQRAYQNQVEASAYIMPIMVAAAILGLDGPAAQTTSTVIVVGRAAFVLLYYTGIPFIRIFGFMAGSFGSLFMAVLVFQTLSGF